MKPIFGYSASFNSLLAHESLRIVSQQRLTVAKYSLTSLISLLIDHYVYINKIFSKGLATLTGFPCERVIFEKSDKEDDENIGLMWARMFSMHRSGYAMDASTPDNIYTKKLTECGLHPSHCYSILKMNEKEGNKLIRLRNP